MTLGVDEQQLIEGFLDNYLCMINYGLTQKAQMLNKAQDPLFVLKTSNRCALLILNTAYFKVGTLKELNLYSYS